MYKPDSIEPPLGEMVRGHGDPVFRRCRRFLRCLVYIGLVLLRRDHERHGHDVLLAPNNRPVEHRLALMFQSWNRLKRALAQSIIVGGKHASSGNMIAQS